MSDASTVFDWLRLAQPVARVLLILLFGWLLLRVLRLVMQRLRGRLLRAADRSQETAAEAHRRVETLVRLVEQTGAVFLYVTLALVLLMQLGVQVGPLVASAGIIGVAVGFGAQSLVRDLLSGFFLVLENQIRVGDVVSINATGGLVEAITLRTIVLRDEAGTVHIFPHGAVTKLSNMTRGWSAYVFDIAIGYDEDPDEVIALLRKIGAALRREPDYAFKIIDDPEVFGVDKLDNAAMVIKGRIKTRPIMQWDVGREFLRRVKLAFFEHGIELPIRPAAALAMPQPAHVRTAHATGRVAR